MFCLADKNIVRRWR